MGKMIPRQSNFELLRIIAMIGVIAHHFAYHGGFDFSMENISINRLWIQFILMGGKIGVNIFVLISGYFLIIFSGGKTKKVLRLWLEIFTYSILIFAVFIFLGLEPFEIKEFIERFFPITYSRWGFASTYFMLFFISPYISMALKGLSKKEYQQLLVLLTICWCIIPTFMRSVYQSNNLLWYVYLYCIAGYFRLYPNKFKLSGKKYILGAMTLIILNFLIVVALDIVGIKFSFFGERAVILYDMQSLPTLLISILMVLGFSKIEIGYKKIINIVASATFGVYLIHDDGYVRSFLWKTLFKNAMFADDMILIPYSIVIIGTVFLVCTLIELIRIYLFEKHYLGLIEKTAALIIIQKDKFLQLFQ